MKLLKSISMMAAVLGLPALLASVPAQAVDSKALPGNACQSTSQGETFTRRDARMINENSGAPNQVYLCPFPKDGTSVSTASLKYVDNSTNGVVTCTLNATNFAGAIIASRSASSPVGSTPTVQILNYFPAPGFGAPGGTYYFRCTLPASASGGSQGPSSIVTYSITENE